MKSNEALGFDRVIESAEITAEGGRDDLSINLVVGRKGKTFRAYSYVWHWEQDASREGYRGECATRGETAEIALKSWRLAALRRGWHAPGVEAAYADCLDELAEAEE